MSIDVTQAGGIQPYAAVSLFDQVTEDAVIRDSGELIQGGDEEYLIGCPLAITEITVRPSEIKSTVTGKFGVYVSIELVVGNERAMNSVRFTRGNDFPWEPDTVLILNDGSTGIRRQVLSYLQKEGMIDVRGEGETNVIVGGTSGNSHYDRSPLHWSRIATSDELPGIEVNIADAEHYSIKFPCGPNTPLRPIFCRRGLRVSNYTNEWTQSGKTYYLS